MIEWALFLKVCKQKRLKMTYVTHCGFGPVDFIGAFSFALFPLQVEIYCSFHELINKTEMRKT